MDVLLDLAGRVGRPSERRVVGEAAAGAAGGPGVVGRGAAALLAAASEAAALLAAEAALLAAEAAALAAAESSALPLGLVDLRGGVAQRRADLVDLDLEDGALLTLAGLVRTLLETSLDDHPHAALQGLGHVLGGLPPDVAREEQRLAVLPLARLAVEVPRGRGEAEGRDRLPARGESQIRVLDEVPDHRDYGVACHGARSG